MKDVLDSLFAIQPEGFLETSVLEDAKYLVSQGISIYREQGHLPSPHLGCYAVVVDLELQKVLLLAHLLANKWLPPGGHCDLDEPPLFCAIRELGEETGLYLEPVKPAPLMISRVKVFQPQDHEDISLWYLFTVDSQTVEVTLQKEEASNAHWFDWACLPEDTDPHLTHFIQKLKNI